MTRWVKTQIRPPAGRRFNQDLILPSYRPRETLVGELGLRHWAVCCTRAAGQQLVSTPIKNEILISL